LTSKGLEALAVVVSVKPADPSVRHLAENLGWCSKVPKPTSRPKLPNHPSLPLCERPPRRRNTSLAAATAAGHGRPPVPSFLARAAQRLAGAGKTRSWPGRAGPTGQRPGGSG
jgi:hypothetical protein